MALSLARGWGSPWESLRAQEAVARAPGAGREAAPERGGWFLVESPASALLGWSWALHRPGAELPPHETTP